MNYKDTNMFIESNQTSKVANLIDISFNDNSIKNIVLNLKKEHPNLFITIGRGSSKYAGEYFSYLIMQELGIASFALPLSLPATNINIISKPTFSFAFSQSGQSPDLIEAVKFLNNQENKSISFVNNIDSPLAKVSSFVFDVKAGEEKSVASTKCCLATMILSIYFVSLYKNDKQLLNNLKILPNLLELQENKNNEINEELISIFKNTKTAFVIGRGLSHSVANEAALKLKETCNIMAQAFSSAEVLHGPAQLIKNDLLLVIFVCKGEEQQGIIEFAQNMKQRNINILIIADEEDCNKLTDDFDYFLSYTNTDSSILSPILALQKFYQFTAQIAVTKGLNPDKPNYLNKVTKTY